MKGVKRYVLALLMLAATASAAAEVELSLEGESSGPVEVVQGRQVLFEVNVTGCDSVGVSLWRYSWTSGDGAEESSGPSLSSPCDESPLTYSHTYTDTGDYTATFEVERCTAFFIWCWNWELFETDQLDVTVSLNPASMIYNYRFDDESWDGSPGEVADYSGNNLDARALGAATDNDTPARPGNPGTCEYGVFSGNERIEAPATDRLGGTTSFSLGTWVRLEEGQQTSSSPALMAYGNTGNDGYAERFEFYLDRTTNPAEYVLALRRENDQVREFRAATGVGGSQDPLNGEWVHLAVTYNGNSRRAFLYVNGNPVANDRLQGPQGLADATAGLGLMGHTGGAFSAAGEMDEPRVVAGVLAEADVESLFLETRPCAATVAAFDVRAPAEASVCGYAEVTLTALNSNGDVVTGYEGDAQLSTSAGHGNWALGEGNSGALTPDPHEADDGAAVYGFAADDNGQAALRLSNERADRLAVRASDPDVGVAGTSDSIQFRENAFKVQTDDPLGNDMVAGRPHQVQVQAIRRNPETGQCDPITAYAGDDVGVKAWVERTGDDPGGEPPVLAGARDSATMPDTRPGTDNITLSFGEEDATVDVAWQTSDVGQYRLRVVDDTSGRVVDINGDPVPVSGSGIPWTVRPFAFDISVPGNDGASSPTGDPFQAAGRPFDVRVRAVQWQAADDGNDDGQPDGHGTADPANRADLSDNAATVSFGTSNPVAELSSTLVAGPPDPADPGLPGAPEAEAFSDGQGTVTTRFDEAGSIAVQASLDGGYLGRPVTVRGRSGFVGRFHPELFTAEPADGAFEPTCNNFAYTGQAHGYDPAQSPELAITPKAYQASGTAPQVTNYRGAWQLLEAGDVSRNFPAEDNDNGLDVSVDRVAEGDLAPLEDGRMLYQFAGDEFIYTRTGEAQVDAFTSDLTLEVTDIDDGDAQLAESQNPVTLQPTGVEIRYGRISLGSVYGPEGLDLIMPLRAEYWDGERFRLNTVDESGIPPAESEEGCFRYSPWNDEDGGDIQIASPDVADNSRSGSTAAEVYGLSEGQPESGNEILLRSARDPVDTDDRQSEVELLNVPDWLKPFDSDGNLQNPSATATFGVYRGHDRIIYWREVQ